MPLTLTILSAAVPAEKRGLALGAWGGIGGLAVAFGPVVGGAVVEGISWQWIFWLNVPIGLVADPARAGAARRSRTARRGGSTCPASALASAGLFGIVWGLVRGNGQGWASPEIVGALGARRASLVAAFVLWELRAREPDAADALLPQAGRSRSRTPRRCSCSSGCSARSSCWRSSSRPCRATRRSAPGCGSCRGRSMPIFIAPIAGALSDRLGRPSARSATGLAAAGRRARVDRGRLDADRRVLGARPPFILAGVGMALFFAPVANVVLSAVRPQEEGQASGANNAIRELGGVFGVAVLAAVFAQRAATTAARRSSTA